MKPVLAFAALALSLHLGACATIVPPPSPSTGSIGSADESWARVLAQVVDDRGRVDFGYLARNRHDLDAYVAFVASHSPASSPQLFPTAEHRLAYHINSYNALAMYGVLIHGMPKSFARFIDRARFFKLTKYHVGGADISLYDYENDVIRPLRDPRIHFALNCMAAGCPRLPRHPFRAETLDRTLDDVTREFINGAKHVQVDSARQSVRLSEIFRFYTVDFVNMRIAPSLIGYVNRYRDVAIPESFRVEFIPYDWTVNRQ